MNQLEVFFDYACPFCDDGHQNLISLLPNFPDIKIVWRPCEAHPRPERYGLHSDLCIQGMLFAADQNVDLWAYHERAYSLILKRRVNVENIEVLSGCFSDMLPTDALKEALISEKYKRAQLDANDYAYEQSGVWAVPAYRMNGMRIDSIENVGVPIEQMKAFLSVAYCADGEQ